MADNRQVSVLDIQVDASQAIESMNKYQQQIELLKKENEDLADAVKEGNKTQLEADEIYTKNAEKIKILNQRIAAQRKAVQNQIKANEENGRSMVALRAELSNLTAEFDNLSKAEREGAKGKELQEKIKAVTKEIKDAEFATDRYYRNVGNYTNSIIDAFGQMGSAASGLGLKGGETINVIVNGIKGLDVSMKALFANPLIALIGIIVGILMAIANAISKNEDLMNRLRVAMAPLNTVVDLFANLLDKAAGVLINMAEILGKVMGYIADFAAGMNESTQSVQDHVDIVNEEVRLEKERRKQVVKSSEQDLKIAELRDKMSQVNRKDVKQRKALLEEVLKIEKEKSDEEVKMAKDEFELLKKKAAQAPNDKAANDALAEAEAKVNRAKREHLMTTRRLNAQMLEFNNTINAEAEAEKKLAEETAKKATEEAVKRRETIKKELRITQDLQIANIKNQGEREAAQLNMQYQRKIADLKERAKKEVAVRNELNQQIKLLEIEWRTKIDDALNKKGIEELKRKQQLLNLEMETIESNGRTRLNKQLAILILERDAELANTELTEQEKYLIRLKYLKKSEDLNKQFEEETLACQEEAIKKANEFVLNQMKLDGATQLEIMEKRIAQTRDMYSRLNEEDADYAEKKQALDLSVMEQEKAIAEQRKKLDDEKTKVLTDNYNKLINSANELTNNDKRLAAIEKTIALGKIAIEEGKAIAKAIADDTGDPYTKALRIAASVASITSSFAKALSSINSAHFATGGYVSGPGNAVNDRSDRIPAMLSNGEFVVNSTATANNRALLEAINGVSGNNAGMSVKANQSLVQQLASAFQAMPAPVVSVEEINRVSNNVKAIENSASF